MTGWIENGNWLRSTNPELACEKICLCISFVSVGFIALALKTRVFQYTQMASKMPSSGPLLNGSISDLIAAAIMNRVINEGFSDVPRVQLYASAAHEGRPLPRRAVRWAWNQVQFIAERFELFENRIFNYSSLQLTLCFVGQLPLSVT